MLKHQQETKGRMALIVGSVRRERRQVLQHMLDFCINLNYFV